MRRRESVAADARHGGGVREGAEGGVPRQVRGRVFFIRQLRRLVPRGQSRAISPEPVRCFRRGSAEVNRLVLVVRQ